MQTDEKNSRLYLSAAIANLLGFSCGIAYGWSSPVLPKLNGKLDVVNNPLPNPATSSEEQWIVGLLSMGAIFVPIFSPLAADKFGRKKTLLIIACPVIVSYFMMAFATSVLVFYIARFVMGLGIGCVFMMLPVYLVEIAEDHNRGLLGCLMGVSNSLGLLFAYGVGPYLTVQHFCLVCSVPLIIFIPAFLVWNPETPVYLASVGDHIRLKESLIKLRSRTIAEIEKEVQIIEKITMEVNQDRGGLQELFNLQHLRKGLMITVGVIFFQQFAGINAVLSYMQTIFDSAGSGLFPEISTIIVAVTQVFATILTSSLADKLGRKILLLFSLSGSSLSLIALGVYFFLQEKNFELSTISWLPVTSLIAFIISFNLGLSSIPWTLMAEIFPPNVKSVALTLTTVMCFIGAFLTSLCFPSLVSFLGMAQSFWLFAVICVIGTCFVLGVVPETKGKSLQEIQGLLGRLENTLPHMQVK